MMISLARAGPTRRTKRVVKAAWSGIPKDTSGIQNSAPAAAQRMSQPRASTQPPPTAWPLTTAIVGCSSPSSTARTEGKRRMKRLLWARKACRRSVSDMLPRSPASAPAQKAGGAPVRSTTRILASSRSASSAASSSTRSASLIALRRAGRFSVTVAMAPARSTTTSTRLDHRAHAAVEVDGRARDIGRPLRDALEHVWPPRADRDAHALGRQALDRRAAESFAPAGNDGHLAAQSEIEHQRLMVGPCVGPGSLRSCPRAPARPALGTSAPHYPTHPHFLVAGERRRYPDLAYPSQGETL